MLGRAASDNRGGYPTAPRFRDRWKTEETPTGHESAERSFPSGYFESTGRRGTKAAAAVRDAVERHPRREETPGEAPWRPGLVCGAARAATTGSRGASLGHQRCRRAIAPYGYERHEEEAHDGISEAVLRDSCP